LSQPLISAELATQLHSNYYCKPNRINDEWLETAETWVFDRPEKCTFMHYGGVLVRLAPDSLCEMATRHINFSDPGGGLSI
jgi:hypothetical protein